MSSPTWNWLGLEGPRRQVEAQVHARRELPDARRDRLDRRHVELHDPVGDLGGGEQARGVREAGVRRRPDEALEADRVTGDERDDRLVDGPERTRGRHPCDGLRQLLGRTFVVDRSVAESVEDLDIGPAVALGPVEGGVGVVGEADRVGAQGRARRDPRREREAPRVVQDRMAARRTGGQAPDDAVCRFGARRRQQERELVAADAERAIRGTHGGADQPAERGQHLVTGGVAIGVVRPLQVVEVDHHERDGLRRANRNRHLDGELLLEGSMVAEPGERIDPRVERGPVVGRARVAELVLEAGPDGLDVTVDATDDERGDHDRGGPSPDDRDDEAEDAADGDRHEARGGDRPDVREPADEERPHRRGRGVFGRRLHGTGN